MSELTLADSRLRQQGVWERFFFAREVPYGMALARISLPLVLLVDIVRRWSHARELYSTDGAIATLHANFGNPGMLPEFSAPVAVGLFTLLGLLFVSSAIGWCTRFSLMASSLLYFYFSYMDCLSTATKYSVISQHVLFLLSLSNCGHIWSVDAWLANRRGAPLEAVGSIWPQRLVQILFGMIYFGAGITKMHTEGFFTGDQLVFWMMTVINNEHPLGDHLTRYPLLVSVSCYATFLWEIVFIFTVFQPRMKWATLAIGTLFHVMTVFSLGLIVFPVVITASYMVFLSESEVRRIATWRGFRWCARFLVSVDPAQREAPVACAPAWALGSMSAFAVTMLMLVVGGVALEYQLDHYQVRGPGGPLPLPEISLEEVREMLGPDRPLREADKLMAFDLGPKLVGEHLGTYRTSYQPGESFVAQATLNPPHGDMWIDCTMCEAVVDENDPEQRLAPGPVLYRAGQIVLRHMFRANFYFTLPDGIAPGEYFLKIRSANQEMARKRFTVLPASSDTVRAALGN